MSPLTLCLAASVCFFGLSPMKPRLGLVALVPGVSCIERARHLFPRSSSSRRPPRRGTKMRYRQLRDLCCSAPESASG